MHAEERQRECSQKHSEVRAGTEEDWATVSGSERIAPYRLDQSRVKRTRLGFSQTSIFIQSLQRPHERRPMASRREQVSALFIVAWTQRRLTECFPWATEGPNPPKETLTFKKEFFWQTTPGSLPAGLKGPQTASRSACMIMSAVADHVPVRGTASTHTLSIGGGPPNVDFTLTLDLHSYSCEFGFVCRWWLLSSSFQCGYIAFDLFFPFPKSNSASQYANDDWQRPTSIVDLTARVPCRFFYFRGARQLWTLCRQALACELFWKRRKHHQNLKVSSHSIVDQSVRIAQLMPVFRRSAASARLSYCGAATFLATESTGTVLTPSQMSEIAGHGHHSISPLVFEGAEESIDHFRNDVMQHTKTPFPTSRG